jgi:hypothetical protein
MISRITAGLAFAGWAVGVLLLAAVVLPVAWLTGGLRDE